MKVYRYIDFSQVTLDYYNFALTGFFKGLGGRFKELRSDLGKGKETYNALKNWAKDDIRRDTKSAKRFDRMGNDMIETSKSTLNNAIDPDSPFYLTNKYWAEQQRIAGKYNLADAQRYRERVQESKDKIQSYKDTYKQRKKDAWNKFWHPGSKETETPSSTPSGTPTQTTQPSTTGSTAGNSLGQNKFTANSQNNTGMNQMNGQMMNSGMNQMNGQMMNSGMNYNNSMGYNMNNGMNYHNGMGYNMNGQMMNSGMNYNNSMGYNMNNGMFYNNR